jgi:hypothetical protein
MDYKEFYQNCYENLEEELGREPTWEETEEYVRNEMCDLVSCYRE